jgi:hypothetical protein
MILKDDKVVGELRTKLKATKHSLEAALSFLNGEMSCTVSAIERLLVAVDSRSGGDAADRMIKSHVVEEDNHAHVHNYGLDSSLIDEAVAAASVAAEAAGLHKESHTAAINSFNDTGLWAEANMAAAVAKEATKLRDETFADVVSVSQPTKFRHETEEYFGSSADQVKNIFGTSLTSVASLSHPQTIYFHDEARSAAMTREGSGLLDETVFNLHATASPLLVSFSQDESTQAATVSEVCGLHSGRLILAESTLRQGRIGVDLLEISRVTPHTPEDRRRAEYEERAQRFIVARAKEKHDIKEAKKLKFLRK